MSVPTWMTEAISGLEYTKRSEPVEYKQIKGKAVGLLGKPMALAWGISLNLESLKKKDGRSVSVGGKTMTYDELLNTLLSQGSEAMKEGIADPSKRIDTRKTDVTVGRLARAFAKETIIFLMKKPSQNPFKQIVAKSNMAVSTKLPNQFAFVNSIYGMSEDEINANTEALGSFFMTFDAIVTEAVQKGWQRDENGKVIEVSAETSSKRRSWFEAFSEFVDFEGWEKNALALIA